MTKTLLAATAALALLPLALGQGAALADGHESLKTAADFALIEDETARSTAIFEEMGKVLTHPRCVNCHPRGDIPLQGELGDLHQPLVLRNETGTGAAGMECRACHSHENVAFLGQEGSVPGAYHWLLAPRSMAWEDFTIAEICDQIKDPERNGQRDLEDLVTHMSPGGDVLVGWSWEPGQGREPVPGDWETFGGLVRAWVDTGAACPS